MTDSRAGVGIESTVNQIEDQERRLSLSLGRGSSQSVIESATRVLTLAPRHPDYIKFDQVPFVYEKLGGQKTNDAVKAVVDDWTQVGFAGILADLQCLLCGQIPGNIHRAADAVGRSASNTTTDIVKAYCGFRFKDLKIKWQPLRGLAVNERKHSTVVIIALEPLNHENGCFVNLAIGEYVCVDGNADVLIPGTGGGLGIFIDLDL